MRRLVALGDLVLDIVVRPSEPLLRGSDVAGEIGFRTGGSAANTCRAFVAAGGRATFIGAVGDDAWGRRLAASLRRDGVTPRLAKVALPTARLVAMLDPGGERSFVTQRGAADRLRPADVRRQWLAGCDALHLPAYSLLTEPLRRAALLAVSVARDRGALISLDLASRGPLLQAGRRTAIERIAEVSPDLLLANAGEVDALTGRRGGRRLLELAPVVVIKEGSAGCRVMWRPAGASSADLLELDVATTPLGATDTTGAGDAFDAGFLYALLSSGAREPAAGTGGQLAGEDRRQALRRAQVLRRAAVAGHRAAARTLAGPRPELLL
ncbi:MAG TPA: PfkB family carbohydrate kinase [Candidatus Limnocylindria bacterium]|nr:PfkB family carbohydrate kinase [Candidatus Limnocylindria bacterium]